jgi:hypothetical protein
MLFHAGSIIKPDAGVKRLFYMDLIPRNEGLVFSNTDPILRLARSHPVFINFFIQ